MNLLEYFELKRDLKYQYHNLFYRNNYIIYKKERNKRYIYLIGFLFSFLILFSLTLYIPIQFELNLITFLLSLFLSSLISILFGLTLFGNSRNKKRCNLYFQNRYFEKLNDIGIKYKTNNSRYKPKLEILERPNTDEAKEHEVFTNLIRRYLEIRSKIATVLSYWWMGSIVGIIVILLILIVIRTFDPRFLIVFFFLNFVISFAIQTILSQRELKYLLPLGANARKWPPKILTQEQMQNEIIKVQEKYE